jgi:hypothetical protein
MIKRLLRTLSIFLVTGLCLAEGSAGSVLVVVGAEGSLEFGESFTKQASVWESAAKRAGHRFAFIGRDNSLEPTDLERLRLALELGEKQGSEVLWVVLIGHGTFDGEHARFNLRGPDVSAADLAGWLATYERPVIVINASSASAPFLKALSAPRRIVLTATRSGYEQSYCRFGEFLAASFEDADADLDKDDQVSLLEAFVVAGNRVEEFYRANGRLASEHALLDDNGDGFGTPADWFRGVRVVRAPKDDARPDGVRAHQIHLLPSEAERALSPEIRQRRDALEMEVFRLRERKDELEESAYYKGLEAILVRLARVYDAAEPIDRNDSDDEVPAQSVAP